MGYVKVENIRPEIIRFAQLMERVMRRHDKLKGDSWKDLRISFLEKKLDEEIEEYKYYHQEDELIDIANVSMMLYFRLDGWLRESVKRFR